MNTLGLVIVIVVTGITLTAMIGILMVWHNGMKENRNARLANFLTERLAPVIKDEQVTVAKETMNALMEGLTKMMNEMTKMIKEMNE